MPDDLSMVNIPLRIDIFVVHTVFFWVQGGRFGTNVINGVIFCTAVRPGKATYKARYVGIILSPNK